MEFRRAPQNRTSLPDGMSRVKLAASIVSAGNGVSVVKWIPPLGRNECVRRSRHIRPAVREFLPDVARLPSDGQADKPRSSGHR